jgi:hypothetical protein
MTDPTSNGALARLEEDLARATRHNYASATVRPEDLRWALSSLSDFVTASSAIADLLDEANARLLGLINRVYGQF